MEASENTHLHASSYTHYYPLFILRVANGLLGRAAYTEILPVSRDLRCPSSALIAHRQVLGSSPVCRLQDVAGARSCRSNPDTKVLRS